MRLHALRPPAGARRRRRRVGRGDGSGRGTTAGRGTKGQSARSGSRVRHAFEGGQTPITRRLPKRRGFRNPTRIEYEVVNVGRLNREFEPGTEVTLALLTERGLIRRRKARRRLKVLGDGALRKPLIVHAHRVSAGARTAIEAAGGSVVLLGVAAAAGAASAPSP